MHALVPISCFILGVMVLQYCFESLTSPQDSLCPPPYSNDAFEHLDGNRDPVPLCDDSSPSISFRDSFSGMRKGERGGRNPAW